MDLFCVRQQLDLNDLSEMCQRVLNLQCSNKPDFVLDGKVMDGHYDLLAEPVSVCVRQ